MRKSTLMAVGLACFAVLSTQIASAEEQNLYLEAKTIKKGYAVQSEDTILTIAIPPKILRKPAWVSIKNVSEGIASPPNVTVLSPIYDIRIHRNETAVILDHFITVQLNIPQIAQDTSIYIWHNPTQEWLRFSSTKKTDTTLRAKMDFSEMRLVVFASSENTSLPSRISMKQPEKIFREEEKGMQAPQEPMHQEIIAVTQGDDPLPVVSDDSIFSITIPKGATIQPVQATITKIPNTYGPPAYRKFISEIYEIEIKNLDGTQPALALPLTSAFVVDRMPAAQRRINFLNNTSWDPLPTSANTNTLTAPLPLPYARIALFESTIIDEGKASWFSDSLTKKTRFGAASNDYPMGTILTVTNTENNKSVDVTVVSTGPFVPGRIIDLTKSAFSAIAKASTGVISVTVQKNKQ